MTDPADIHVNSDTTFTRRNLNGQFVHVIRIRCLRYQAEQILPA